MLPANMNASPVRRATMKFPNSGIRFNLKLYRKIRIDDDSEIKNGSKPRKLDRIIPRKL
jgi:hypothetical protein